jgi:hypothetical protein
VPRSRTPLIIVGLLAFIAVAGGAVFMLQNKDSKGEVVTPPPVVRTAVDAGAAVAVAEPTKVPEPEPVKDPVAKAEPVALDTITVEGKVWKVLHKDGEDLLMLDKKDKLQAGDRVNLVGEAGTDGKRPVFAHAAVLSVNSSGSIAKLLFDEDATLPDKVFAARDASPKKPVVVAKKDPLKTDPATGKLGDPKTPEPEPVKAPEPEPVKTQPVAEPVKTAPGNAQLYGTVRMSVPNLAGSRAVFLRSQNAFILTDCEVRLPSNMVFRFGKRNLSANDQVKVTFKEFRADSRPPDPQFGADWAIVYCHEGTGYWKTTYDRR